MESLLQFSSEREVYVYKIPSVRVAALQVSLCSTLSLLAPTTVGARINP